MRSDPFPRLEHWCFWSCTPFIWDLLLNNKLIRSYQVVSRPGFLTGFPEEESIPSSCSSCRLRSCSLCNWGSCCLSGCKSRTGHRSSLRTFAQCLTCGSPQSQVYWAPVYGSSWLLTWLYLEWSTNQRWRAHLWSRIWGRKCSFNPELEAGSIPYRRLPEIPSLVGLSNDWVLGFVCVFRYRIYICIEFITHVCIYVCVYI